MYYLLNDEKLSAMALTFKAIKLDYVTNDEINDDPTITMRTLENIFVENGHKLVKVNDYGRYTVLTMEDC